MHQRSVSLPCHPHGRTRPATRSRVGQHTGVRESTAGKKEGGGSIRGTQESDRIASLAPAETEVRAGAVLAGGGGPEHQATGPIPKPTDNTHCGGRLLAELRQELDRRKSSQPKKDIPITDFFNTHRRLHALTLLPRSPRERAPAPRSKPGRGVDNFSRSVLPRQMGCDALTLTTSTGAPRVPCVHA